MQQKVIMKYTCACWRGYTTYEDRGNNRQNMVSLQPGKYIGASKSRGNVGFSIGVAGTYMFTVLIFFAFHIKQFYILYMYPSIPNFNY